MKTSVLYFSPTGTTKLITNSIAKGIGFPIEEYNLTPFYSDVKLKITDGIAIFGIPVYGGRVPLIVSQRIRNIRGEEIPAVIIAMYGNRDFEDALVELRDIVSEVGFRVIAGGAFIGEHSYPNDDKPIAKGRPDADDISVAKDFGASIKKKLLSENSDSPFIKGNVPYKERLGKSGATPLTRDELCIACGTCKKACPTDAITITSVAVSDADKCIMCCACMKKCSKNARYIANPILLERIDMLVKNCSARKEPSIFI